jgi:hypothetical protein
LASARIITKNENLTAQYSNLERVASSTAK